MTSRQMLAREVEALGDLGRRTARNIATYHEPNDDDRELIAVAYIEGVLAGLALDRVGRACVLARLGLAPEQN